MNLRAVRGLWHKYVREVFGGVSGNCRQGAELRGIGDEPAWGLYHRLRLFDRRRRDGKLLLRVLKAHEVIRRSAYNGSVSFLRDHHAAL